MRHTRREIGVEEAFRPGLEMAGIVDGAIEHDDVEVIWLQLEVHADAIARAEAAELWVV